MTQTDKKPDLQFQAESWNVYLESGLTPRQLLEQRDKLLEALKPLAEIPVEQFFNVSNRQDNYVLMGWNDHKLTMGNVRAARAAINKVNKSKEE